MDRNYGLVLAWVTYAVLNVLMVFLASGGVIHPPWGILTFFSFIGPVALSGAVLVMHIAVARFNAAVLVGFFILMVLMAVLNTLVFAQAATAV